VDDGPLRFACAFCDEEREEDPIQLTASIGETWQVWGVHPSCLIAALTEDAQEAGGPLFGDED
jgi:hypothetical protein